MDGLQAPVDVNVRNTWFWEGVRAYREKIEGGRDDSLDLARSEFGEEPDVAPTSSQVAKFAGEIEKRTAALLSGKGSSDRRRHSTSAPERHRKARWQSEENR